MLGLYYRGVSVFKCMCGREPEHAYMLVHAHLWVCLYVREGDSGCVEVHACLHVRGVYVHIYL